MCFFKHLYFSADWKWTIPEIRLSSRPCSVSLFRTEFRVWFDRSRKQKNCFIHDRITALPQGPRTTPNASVNIVTLTQFLSREVDPTNIYKIILALAGKTLERHEHDGVFNFSVKELLVKIHRLFVLWPT